MNKIALTEEDYALIEMAHKEFSSKTRHDWHGVSCAIRLASGKIITGLVLETEVPALTICAEPIVIGKALNELHEDPVRVLVATRSREQTRHKVIPPCGRCREFITDYCSEADVIIYDGANDTVFRIPAVDLLPFRYRRV